MSRIAIPGTHEPGYEEQPIIQLAIPASLRDHWKAMGAHGLKRFRMGECTIILAREPIGANQEMLWHLTISTPHRHPTWDEIKTVRYRLLPLDVCFGMLLPPPELYVNLEAQDHTFHLHEIRDVREPWTSG